MGNITNKPKAPAQVVYVPQPVYQTPTETSNNNNNTGGDNPAPTVAEQREKSLLSRNRSRLGTILTGFRGLLAPLSNENSQRKTLLGE